MANYGTYVCNLLFVSACAAGAIMYHDDLSRSLPIGVLGLVMGASSFIPDRRKPSKLENQQQTSQQQ